MILEGWFYQHSSHKSPNSDGNHDGLPWIMYSQPASVVRQDPALKWKYRLSGKETGATASLTYWLSKYSVDGKYLGMEVLKNQLELCAALGGDSSASSSTAIGSAASTVMTWKTGVIQKAFFSIECFKK